MADRLYSYRDVLPGELDAAWRRSCDEGEADEPEMVLAGFVREAVVVTETRIYRLSAGVFPFGDGGERVAVRALSDLTEAHVREGLFVCRLNLLFATGDQLQLRVRVIDRDKMRVAARMLTSLSLRAQEIARDEAIERQRKARAEAAAGHAERVRARVAPLRPVTPESASATPAPLGAAVTGSPTDTVELLKGLWQLVEAGALTGAEYEAKKADLLSRL